MVIFFFIGYMSIEKDITNYSNLIIFITFMIGFDLISIATLMHSKVKKILYDRKRGGGSTDLHMLRDFFKYSIAFKTLFILIMFLFPYDNITLYGFVLGKYLLFSPALFGTIYLFHVLIHILLKIFVYPVNE